MKKVNLRNSVYMAEIVLKFMINMLSNQNIETFPHLKTKVCKKELCQIPPRAEYMLI